MTRRRSRSRALARYGDGLTGSALPPWALPVGGLSILFLLGSSKSGGALVSSVTSSVTGLLGRGFDFAKAQAFKLALPSNIGRWSPYILSAAQRYGVDPWVLAGIMYNESLGGDAPGYLPKGSAGGTGDHIPRGPPGRTLPAGWVASKYHTFANPKTGLPPDGLGWGRGLMQIDYGAHNAWFASGANWRDPQVNIDKAASIFKESLDFFRRPAGKPVAIESWRVTTGMPGYGIEPWSSKYGVRLVTSAPDPRPLSGSKLYEAALAAYNAGPMGPLQAIALGIPAEAATTRQHYVTKFLSRVAPWIAKLG